MTRDMQLLIVARAFMSSGRALAGVVAPIYLAKIGFDGSELGILFAVTAIISAVLTGAVAFLSDRLGRKAFIIGVPLLAAAAGVVFAVTQNPAIVFIAAAAGSFGRGAGAAGGNIGPYQPAEQAYLADSVAPQVRNSLFGRVAFASSLGAVIGVGVLAWIPDVAQALGLGELNSYRPVFVVLAFVSLVAALLPLPIAPRRAVHTGGGKAPITLPRKSWRLLLRLGVTNGMNGLAIGFFGPFITYWFYTRFNAGPGTVGTLYAVINVASMASNLSAASIADRLGVVKTIVVTRALAAIMIVPMVLAPHFWLRRRVFRPHDDPARWDAAASVLRDGRGPPGGTCRGRRAIEPSRAGHIGSNSGSRGLPVRPRLDVAAVRNRRRAAVHQCGCVLAVLPTCAAARRGLTRGGGARPGRDHRGWQSCRGRPMTEATKRP